METLPQLVQKRCAFDPSLFIGVRLPEEVEHIQFGKSGIPSPYAALIQQLVSSPCGAALEFKDGSVKKSLSAQAKKAGVKLEFALEGGHFYARLTESDDEKRTPVPGRLALQGGFTSVLSMTDAVMAAVRESPRTSAEVKDRVIELIPDAKRDSVDSYLFNFKEKGHIAKDSEMRWKLTGTGAARK